MSRALVRVWRLLTLLLIRNDASPIFCLRHLIGRIILRPANPIMGHDHLMTKQISTSDDAAADVLKGPPDTGFSEDRVTEDSK